MSDMSTGESMSGDRANAQLERLAFFSDAVFAIAITLLVIEVRVPEIHGATEAALRHALLSLAPQYIGFVVSFAVIGRFWLGHHRLFGMLAKTDDRMIVANLILLLGIAFMPFPTAVFSEYAGSQTAALLYAGWLLVVGLFNRRLMKIAVRDHLLADDHDAALRSHVLRGTWLPILLGLLAMGGALIHPLATLGVLVIGPVIGSLVLHLARGRKAA
jgi:uncharacterized membrane protein